MRPFKKVSRSRYIRTRVGRTNKVPNRNIQEAVAEVPSDNVPTPNIPKTRKRVNSKKSSVKRNSMNNSTTKAKRRAPRLRRISASKNWSKELGTKI
jgi:hypothetical protein